MSRIDQHPAAKYRALCAVLDTIIWITLDADTPQEERLSQIRKIATDALPPDSP